MKYHKTIQKLPGIMFHVFFLTQRVARSKCNLWAEHVESLLMMNVTINHVCLLQFGTPQLWAIDAGTGHSSQAYPWGYTNYEFSVGATSHPAWKPWARWWFQNVSNTFFLFHFFHFFPYLFLPTSDDPNWPILLERWLNMAQPCQGLPPSVPSPWTVDRGAVVRWCGAMSGHEGCQPEGWMMVGWSGKEFWTCAIWIHLGVWQVSDIGVFGVSTTSATKRWSWVSDCRHWGKARFQPPQSHRPEKHCCAVVDSTGDLVLVGNFHIALIPRVDKWASGFRCVEQGMLGRQLVGMNSYIRISCTQLFGI